MTRSERIRFLVGNKLPTRGRGVNRRLNHIHNQVMLNRYLLLEELEREGFVMAGLIGKLQKKLDDRDTALMKRMDEIFVQAANAGAYTKELKDWVIQLHNDLQVEHSGQSEGKLPRLIREGFQTLHDLIVEREKTPEKAMKEAERQIEQLPRKAQENASAKLMAMSPDVAVHRLELLDEEGDELNWIQSEQDRGRMLRDTADYDSESGKVEIGEHWALKAPGKMPVAELWQVGKSGPWRGVTRKQDSTKHEYDFHGPEIGRTFLIDKVVSEGFASWGGEK